jgi:hypothetical protein
MVRGGKVLFVGACFVASGCASTQNVQVRAIPDPSAKMRYSGGVLAEARAQLAFNSVGLALETFRKLQREQPNNPEVFAGIAACYAAMGRYDLERANYEFALAYAPHDPALLSALASSLDRQGETDRAAKIRQEIALLAAPPAAAQVAVAQREGTNLVPMAVPHLGSVTVKLPPVHVADARRVTLDAHMAVALPALEATEAPAPVAIKTDASKPVATLAARPAIADPAVRPERMLHLADAPAFVAPAVARLQVEKPLYLADLPALLVPVTAVTRTVQIADNAVVSTPQPVTDRVDIAPSTPPALGAVTVALPQVQPMVEAALALSSDLAPASALVKTAATPAAAKNERLETATAKSEALEPRASKKEALDAADPPHNGQALAEVPFRHEAGPYLERVSLGEVALVTTGGPIWQAQRAPRTAQTQLASRTMRPQRGTNLAMATPVRWLPLGNVSGRPTIQLLNAARSQSLAANTRTALFERGWRKIGIGNARTVRKRSLVLYTALRTATARRLAAHFGCKAVRIEGGDRVIVLLGRDAASRRAASSRA